MHWQFSVGQRIRSRVGSFDRVYTGIIIEICDSASWPVNVLMEPAGVVGSFSFFEIEPLESDFQRFVRETLDKEGTNVTR